MSTQILLTNRNSPWGVLVNPVASNTYQHILSWDDQETKNWFINKYLFKDENFDYLSELRKQPDKPITRTTATSANFTIDKDMYKNLTNEEILNKDLAIILETDANGKEDISFWAVKNVVKKAPFLYQFDCELDIFFTYNVKDMFKKGLQTPIKRAMSEQFIKDEEGNWIPNISLNSINYLEEEIEQGLKPNIFEKEIWRSEQPKMYLFLSPKKQETNNLIYVDGYSTDNETVIYSAIQIKPFDVVKQISFITGDVPSPKFNWDISFSSIPYIIIEIRDNISKSLLFTNSTYSGAISPISLTNIYHQSDKSNNLNFNFGFKFSPFYSSQTSDPASLINIGDLIINGLNETNVTYISNPIISNKGYKEYSVSIDFNINYSTDINSTQISDIGKIYKNNYFNYNITDYMHNNYQIPISYLDNINKINFYIDTTIDTMSTFSIIGLKGKYFDNDINNIYGIENTYNLTPPRQVGEWDAYANQNQTRFNNQLKNAQRHKLQNIVSGAFNAITGTASAVATGNITGAVSSSINAFSEISNASEEVNNLKATQQDLQNSPDQITNASTLFWKINLDKNLKYGLINNEDQKWEQIPNNKDRPFYQISKYKLPDQLLNSIKWYYHLAGVYYGGNLYDVNDLIDTNYYFNHIQTSGSLFENIKDEITFSQEIRNIIDASFKQGITIWHIRDKATFKGIKNYQVNNVWMEHLKNE